MIYISEAMQTITEKPFLEAIDIVLSWISGPMDCAPGSHIIPALGPLDS